MPGGQYTNLKEQAAAMGLAHRWPEIARCYAEVNQLFGDIVKVTPDGKEQPVRGLRFGDVPSTAFRDILEASEERILLYLAEASDGPPPVTAAARHLGIWQGTHLARGVPAVPWLADHQLARQMMRPLRRRPLLAHAGIVDRQRLLEDAAVLVLLDERIEEHGNR